MSTIYEGAREINDKHGAELHAYEVVTLEQDRNGTDHLGWALVAGRDFDDARRQARRLWPAVSVLAVTKGAPMH